MPSDGIAGALAGIAEERLHKAGFQNVTSREIAAELEPPDASAYYVVSVDPPAGSRVSASQPVTLWYASGMATIPPLYDLPLDVAQREAARAGFTNVRPAIVPQSGVPGMVLRTVPEAGQTILKKDPLTLYYVGSDVPLPTPQIPTDAVTRRATTWTKTPGRTPVDSGQRLPKPSPTSGDAMPISPTAARSPL